MKHWEKIVLAVLIQLPITYSFAAKVDTICIESLSMHKVIRNLVILPDGYEHSTSCPVVYVLHGAYGDYSDWVKKAPVVASLSDRYHVLIVCPDGDTTSWYFDSPVDSSYRYETYISQELLRYVDAHYRTIATKEGRAITGLSMGGHGALYLAIRHQNLYGAAGSMSGGVDFRPFAKNWDIAKRLGSYEQYPDIWNNHTVMGIADLLKNGTLKLIFDCGVDDFFHTVNLLLHNKLMEMNYPHDYIERPGMHDWSYWSNSIKYQLLFFHEYFRANIQSGYNSSLDAY